MRAMVRIWRFSNVPWCSLPYRTPTPGSSVSLPTGGRGTEDGWRGGERTCGVVRRPERVYEAWHDERTALAWLCGGRVDDGSEIDGRAGRGGSRSGCRWTSWLGGGDGVRVRGWARLESVLRCESSGKGTTRGEIISSQASRRSSSRRWVCVLEANQLQAADRGESA